MTIFLLILVFALASMDAYLVTHRKPRPPRKISAAEEEDLLWTSPREWVDQAVAKVLGKGSDGNQDQH